MTTRTDRAAAAIIAGTSRRKIALAVMEAYRTWPGCRECLPGCDVRKSRTRKMCPRYALHIEASVKANGQSPR